MKTALKYRYICLMVALHCAMICSYGQNYVTGNQYALKSVIKTSISVTKATVGGNSVNTNTINNLFDNNEGSYWLSDRGGTLEMILDFGATHARIDVLNINGGGELYERPTHIKIEQGTYNRDTFNPTGGPCADVDLSIAERYPEIIMTTPITREYVRITFTRTDGSKLAFNDLIFSTYAEMTDVLPVIRHKPAKFYELRNGVSESAKALDTFNDLTPMMDPAENPYISAYDSPIQSAHTYVDTIYMHRGTSITLEVPDFLGANNCIKSYQRWYSFRSDKTFETTDKSDGVYDLLTPASDTKPMRFANGYVGNPVVESAAYGGTSANNYDAANSALTMNFYMPTHDEFAKWFKGATGFDDRWFVVACDVSGYNDYTETYDENKSSNSVFYDGTQTECWEPTLTHRVLFYIVAVDGRGGDKDPNWSSGHGRLTSSEYHKNSGTTYSDADKFLEDYKVIGPYYRLNDKQNNTKYSDALALSKDARSYVIPDVAATSDTEKLDVSIVENTAGISFLGGGTTTTVSGKSRLIQFDYPTITSNGMLAVNGETATIIVTKTVNGITYNLIRYRLVFDKETTLLPQSIINKLDNGDYDNDDMWANYKIRTPAYLKEHFQLLTSMTWDYDQTASNTSRPDYYQYPMDWGYSSYGFYDGSYSEQYKGGDVTRKNPYTEWGHYSITKSYVEKDAWGIYTGTISAPETAGYHLFIDASDHPGTIAMLPFRETLCVGAELFVSAWVKEAGYSSLNAGSGMQFTIKGVTTNADGTTAYVPLCQYSTGQFCRTTFYSSNFPGCGTDTDNEWLHVYFSFVNLSEVQYDSYLLQVDNNSVSTNGADMYLDAVHVFVAQPTAEVKQKELTCGNEETRMNIKLDWERLMSRTGGSTVDGMGIGAIDFCFVDRLKYETELARLSQEGVADSVEQALGAAVVKTETGEFKSGFSQLYYYIDYDKNTVYGTDGKTLAKDNLLTFKGEEKGCFYGQTEDGVKSLSVDFYSTLTTNRPYWILLKFTNTSGEYPTLKDFAADFSTPCAIKTEFYISPLNQVTIEGEILDPTLNEYCEGQLLNFHANMRYTTQNDEDGNPVYEYLDGVRYDWFFGSEDDFTRKADESTFSVEGALKSFRDVYPDASELPDVYDESLHTDGFSEEMYDTISHYVNEGRLILYKSALDIRLKSPGLELVLKPVYEKTYAEDSALCCWSYIPLTLCVVDGAPTLLAGYSGLKYPDINGESYAPNMRIGLQQIKKATDESNSLTCNLRVPEVVSSQSTHVGRVTAHESANLVYLVDTDDPEMRKWLEPEEGVSLHYALPIGYVDYLRANKIVTTAEPNQVKVHFDLDGTEAKKIGIRPDFKFVPREGYKYKFSVYFEEKVMKADGVSESAGNSCVGMFHITICVVPEYLIWSGESLDNWNNDDHWTRVNSAERIKKTDGYDVYTEKAFVPMQFSKVILPRDSKVELYAAGYNQSDVWNNDGRPEYIGEPTSNIQYDLMVVERPETAEDNPGKLVTERFRVYLIDQIHFEPGSQMRGAEYMIYDKAWVDYELEAGKWHSVTSPLQGTVAGDFYTDSKTSVEQGEYFKPVTFNENVNSRLMPSVFQRDWDAESANLMREDGTEFDVGATGQWSGLYNDVNGWETYQPGCGFSLKPENVKADNNKALFRLPKADETYAYYDLTGKLSGHGKSVKEHRTDHHGRLITDSLFHRVAYDINSSEGEDIKIGLPGVATGIYYMIGNPFMTYLDVEQFFNENADVLEPKYWVTDDNDLTAVKSEDGWVTSVGSANIAPLKAFFVQKKDDAEGDSIKIGRHMQAMFPEAEKYLEESPGTAALRITASTEDGRSSHAAVCFVPASTDNGGVDYSSTRSSDGMSSYGCYAGGIGDGCAELFIDPNRNDIPAVYTVGGNCALSINTAAAGSRIPLGVRYGDGRSEVVTLTFEGVSDCGDVSLYDARTGNSTPLTDSYTLSVTSADEGRYYLMGRGADGVAQRGDLTQNEISVYSVRRGEITVVSTTSELTSVHVYGAGGGMLKTAACGSRVVNVPVTSGAVYVVRATSADGITRTAKLLVK